MNIKICLSLIVLCSIISFASAQNDADVLRYGMVNYGSTARSLGMGNSFSALGADFSCLATNPAGIGLFRHSEFTFSPLFSNRTDDNTFSGNSSSDNFFKFSFGNLGAVFTGNAERPGHFKSWTFGIGYNKLNDFNSRSSASAVNTSSSLLDNFTEAANGINYNNLYDQYPFDVDLAWQQFLIDTIPGTVDQYFNNATPFAGELQTRSVKTRGGQGEWDFSFGTNIDNKLFLGGTFGLNTVRYEENISWKENDASDTIPFFSSFQYNTRLKTSGTGLNFKLGAIYKPADFLRIGAAIHTPTYFTLSDEYSSNISANLDDNDYTVNSPVFVPYDYYITTPFKAIGSIGLILGNSTAINLEYEFQNYKQGRLETNDDVINADFATINSAIKSNYRSSHSIRAGGEYRIEDLRFRIGGNYSTTPFKSSVRNDQQTNLSRIGASVGFGIKEEHFFADFAYAYTITGYYTEPYSVSFADVPVIKTRQIDNRLMVTFGFTF